MLKNFDVSIRTSKLQDRKHRLRKGMAPVEMVLVLPFLMMLMATVIVFGYAAMWKLRTENVSRDAVWRARFGQFSNSNAQLVEWPEGAESGVAPDTQITTFDSEPILHDELIVGPLGNIGVNQEVLNYSRGNMAGVATINRDPPVFASLLSFNFEVEQALLDDRFQFQQMGVPNVSRRFPVLFQTPLD